MVLIIRYTQGDSVLDLLIEKVVTLLTDKIPLPIRKVSFCVSKYDLLYGDFVNSKKKRVL